jgi:hypothetical protein
VKHLIVALASIVALVAANGQASAQVVASPKFTGTGGNGYRGPFPGFASSSRPIATNINPASPATVLYSVSGFGGIVTPASYLGSNLGLQLNTTYQGIVTSNAVLSLQSNSGQFGNFGNLGSQGAQGGQVGQVGQAGVQGGVAGNIGGGVGGVGGKIGAGGAIGAIGALGSRYYGI